MPWRGPHGPDDPLLATTRHPGANRKHWKRLRRPCAVCGLAIDYTGKTFIVVAGVRRLNPRSLVVGHIVDRATAKRLGWSAAQINSLSNTRPECARCSVKSGAKLGRRLQGVPGLVRHPNPTRRGAGSRWISDARRFGGASE